MAAVPVAVVDPLPAYREGLITAFRQAGFSSEEPADLLAWSRGNGRRVLVATLDREDDEQHARTLLALNPRLVLVGLVSDTSPDAARRLLSLGARSVVMRSASVETIIDTLKAAVMDRIVFPPDVAHALAAEPPCPAAPMLKDIDRRWLRALARGVKVTELARTAGYSEREMYRRLSKLYKTLGASCRVEALVIAARHRLLE